MGECGQDWQAGATTVRDRMDHLFNNPDMADLSISAADPGWTWGQTTKEFTVRFTLNYTLIPTLVLR